MTTQPQLDTFSREYLRLVLEIHKHIDGYIDAYYGPESLRVEVNTGPPKNPAELLSIVRTLQGTIPPGDSSREAYLSAVLRAIETTVRMLAGEAFEYLDEVHRVYDIRPTLVDESIFRQAHQELEPVLPQAGSENLADRLATWRRGFEVTGNAIMPLLEMARVETRRRTLEQLDLPVDESIELRLTSNQPWGAYNWYLGNSRSLIEFNTDIPIMVSGLIGTMAHEGYPGHHTEHSLKELLLYRQHGFAEHAATLLHSPSAVIAEGIATKALEMIFPDGTNYEWNEAVMFPAAGIHVDSDLARQIRQLSEAIKPLQSVTSNAAILYHTGELSPPQTIDYIRTYGLVTQERAEKSFSFLSHPLFRSYIFTYSIGYDLISNTADPAATFRNLLTSQVLPSQLVMPASTQVHP